MEELKRCGEKVLKQSLLGRNSCGGAGGGNGCKKKKVGTIHVKSGSDNMSLDSSLPGTSQIHSPTITNLSLCATSREYNDEATQSPPS